MRRREFIGLVGGAATWPVAARAQQSMPVVGILSTTTFDDGTDFIGLFRRGLQEAGYTEGKNVTIDFRSADNLYDRLPRMVAEFVHNRVAVIVARGAVNAALAAKAGTKTIPIVFMIGSDPVEHRLVASLGRPEANVTGLTLSSNVVGAKRLELFRELVPNAKSVGLLVNPGNPNGAIESRDIQKVAATLNLTVQIAPVKAAPDLEPALASMARSGTAGFLHPTDIFITSHYRQLIDLAARYKLAAIYGRRDGPAGGGLASYGAQVSDTYRLVGLYTGRILQGSKPADLPVQQPTKFELAINMKTAQTLGITVPTAVLLRATEVIE